MTIINNDKSIEVLLRSDMDSINGKDLIFKTNVAIGPEDNTYSILPRFTTNTTGIDFQAESVAYSPELDLIVAVGSSKCFSSSDGASWTEQTIPVGAYKAVIWCADLLLFIAVGASICATSPDGVVWTSRTIPVGAYNSVAWNGTLLVAVGVVCSTSTDGITWARAFYDIPSTASYDHTAVLLGDGRLLITGGTNGSVSNKTYFGTISDEIITWESGTDLPAAMYGHTLTLLGDGRILVMGGWAGAAAFSSTYFGTISGNTISWANGTNMSAARRDHTTTLLTDGRVLVMGGYSGSVKIETYFGTIATNTITWAAGTNLPAVTSRHTATLLDDGRVLLAGGVNGLGANFPTAATYFGTIATNTITWAAGTDLPAPRSLHTTTLLTDDRIVIIAGATTGGIDIATIYFGTISTNTITWASGTKLPSTNEGHSATLLVDGRILVTGGYISDYTAKTYFGTIATNAIAWNIEPNGNAIAWSGSMYVVVGASVCWTSADGETWFEQTISTGTYHAVIWNFDFGLLVAVGENGTEGQIATSSDGILWVIRQTFEDTLFKDIAWSDYYECFLAVAGSDTNENVIYISENGMLWVLPEHTPVYNYWTATCWVSSLNGFIVLGGEDAGTYPTVILTSPIAEIEEQYYYSYVKMSRSLAGITLSIHQGECTTQSLEANGWVGDTLYSTYVANAGLQITLRILYTKERICVYLNDELVISYCCQFISWPDVVDSYLFSTSVSGTMDYTIVELSEDRDAIYFDMQSTVLDALRAIIQERPVKMRRAFGYFYPSMNFFYKNPDASVVTGLFVSDISERLSIADSAASDSVVYGMDVFVATDLKFLQNNGYLTNVIKIPNINSGGMKAVTQAQQDYARKSGRTIDSLLSRFDPSLEQGDIMRFDAEFAQHNTRYDYDYEVLQLSLNLSTANVVMKTSGALERERINRYTLTDESGNILVDENGNTLVSLDEVAL